MHLDVLGIAIYYPKLGITIGAWKPRTPIRQQLKKRQMLNF